MVQQTGLNTKLLVVSDDVRGNVSPSFRIVKTVWNGGAKLPQGYGFHLHAINGSANSPFRRSIPAAAQDFKIAGALLEVKTCQLGSWRVLISSIEQLDAGEDPIWLAVVRMSISPVQSEAAISLNTAVERVRSMLSADADIDEFNLRLAEAGFDEQAKSAEVYYQVDEIRGYREVDGFPRILRDQVPGPVVSASYVVDVDQCSNFEIELGEI